MTLDDMIAKADVAHAALKEIDRDELQVLVKAYDPKHAASFLHYWHALGWSESLGRYLRQMRDDPPKSPRRRGERR